MQEYSQDQREFISKLERLVDYAGKPADDEARELIAEIQDEFAALKRGAVRERLATDARLTVQDVLDFGGYAGQEFPKAQRGCELFVSVWFAEKVESAPQN